MGIAMKMQAACSLVLVLALVACQLGDGLDDYYAQGGSAPELSGLDPASVPGNTGGQTVVIQGSGFGSDPSVVTVVFGDVNAEIQSITDGRITVTVPQGPLQGGAVAVRVGTAGGQGLLQDGFRYDLGSLYEDQTAYIVINNDWFSCIGGIGGGGGDGEDAGCDTSAWVGLTGTSGRGEFMEDTPFSRQHGQFVGAWGGPDVSMGEWTVELPPYQSEIPDIEGAVQNLRDKNITHFSLRNDEWGDTPYCADVSTLATYTYGGGDPVDPSDPSAGLLAPQTVGTAGLQLSVEADRDGGACADDQDRLYNLSTLDFCQTWSDQAGGLKSYQRSGTWIYQADWPVGEDFFVGQGSGGDPWDDALVQVSLDVPEAGIDQVPLTLPPDAHFAATTGFDASWSEPQQWGASSLSACPDGNGDGISTLDEPALRFEWQPTDLGDVVGGSVKDVDVVVRLTLSSLRLGFAGDQGFDLRASIQVPDAWNVDASTGLSQLELPTSILAQFPSLTTQIGEFTSSKGDTVFVYGDPLSGSYGTLVVTLERVTEYRLDAPQLAGDLVLAYVTGDLGFYDWTNPLDGTDACGPDDGSSG
ncbi:MAG: hypothetical protein GXP62_15960 [Oligoflexia bacterium]|nr:hypothetical protein [Oligoflexia bacterium]